MTSLNIEAKLKAAILLGFSFLLYWLLDSGKIAVYINPRFAGFTKAAAAVMFIMFIVQAFRPAPRTHCDHSRSNLAGGIKWGYIAFIVPLLMAYLLPHSALDANMAANKRIGLSAGALAGSRPGALNQDKNDPAVQAGKDKAGAAGESAVSQDGKNSGTAAGGQAESIKPGTNDPAVQKGVNDENAPENSNQVPGLIRPLAEELRQAGLISVTDENFNHVMSELYMFLDDYTGKEITMIGFVDRDDSFFPNQFGLARYVITCCSADAVLGGLVCEYNEAAGLKKGTWLEVRGTIKKGLYNQQSVPMIKVTSFKISEEPQNPYIYP